MSSTIYWYAKEAFPQRAVSKLLPFLFYYRLCGITQQSVDLTGKKCYDGIDLLGKSM